MITVFSAALRDEDELHSSAEQLENFTKKLDANLGDGNPIHCASSNLIKINVTVSSLN